jgi:GntR family transcriptional regulator, transcriptional repressor for pyruvate dehydrogenase complex
MSAGSNQNRAKGRESSPESRLKPVTPRTVSDQVAEQLRYLINSGEYKPGDKIPGERDLATHMGVGRPAVREALRELKAHGLLISGRGARGTVVAGMAGPQLPTPMAQTLGSGAERIVELMEVRSAVEIEAAGLAARRATIEDLHRLSDILSGGSERITPELDVAFHAAIAEATHNPLFETVIREPVDLLHDHMAAILSAYYAEPGGAAALQQQHDAIRKAIRSGNEQKARQAMRQHLDYVARGLAQLVGAGRVIRLIFINLDGTLLSGPRRMSERAKRTIGTVREAGVEIVLYSSRPPRAIRPFHQQLGLQSPVIACSGALLWNVQSAAGLVHVPLDPQLATEIIGLGRKLGAAMNIESDDDWFADRLTQPLQQSIDNRDIPGPDTVGDLEKVLQAGDPIDKLYLDLRDMDVAAAEAALRAVRQTYGDKATIDETSPGFVNITSTEASKASMAQRLARQMQIPADQTMAIGDHDNDATLLQWAGIGVAMGNATPSAKAAADVITSSNLRDGVAEALEQWVLGRKSMGAMLSVPNPDLVSA